VIRNCPQEGIITEKSKKIRQQIPSGTGSTGNKSLMKFVGNSKKNTVQQDGKNTGFIFIWPEPDKNQICEKSKKKILKEVYQFILTREKIESINLRGRQGGHGHNQC